MPFKPLPAQPDLNKLKAVLLTSGIQIRDNALYEVINQLIDAVIQFQSVTNSSLANVVNIILGSGGVIHSQTLLGIDGIDGEDGFIGPPGIDGRQGIDGAAGIQGPPGMDGLDGEPGEDGFSIIGPRGPQGPAGGGGGSATTIEQDLGSTAVWRGNFTLTDALISPTSKVLMWQAPGPYTNKGTRADEAELQPVSIIAVNPGSGSALVYWQTPPYLTDKKSPRMGQSIASPGNQKDPQDISYGIPTRLGKVRGNVKFTYMVM